MVPMESIHSEGMTFEGTSHQIQES